VCCMLDELCLKKNSPYCIDVEPKLVNKQTNLFDVVALNSINLQIRLLCFEGQIMIYYFINFLGNLTKTARIAKLLSLL